MEEKIIKTAKCGLLKIFVQGEIESRDFKRKSKAVFLTVHDLGSNYKSIVRFVNHPSMVNISSRYLRLRLKQLLRSMSLSRRHIFVQDPERRYHFASGPRFSTWCCLVRRRGRRTWGRPPSSRACRTWRRT